MHHFTGDRDVHDIRPAMIVARRRRDFDVLGTRITGGTGRQRSHIGLHHNARSRVLDRFYSAFWLVRLAPSH